MKVLLSFLIFLFSASAFAQDEITKEYLIGKINPQSDSRFSSSGGYYLRNEAMESFLEMRKAAKEDGINLRIISATRTFDYQKGIWERKWKTYSKRLNPDTIAVNILRYSAMPSASRHHWGTDLDINSLSLAYWRSKKGRTEYKWLVENAPTYGFCQPYTANRPSGYNEEKWHWSFFPLSKPLTQAYKTLISDTEIADLNFLGSGTAANLNIVKNYVLGINSDCQE